MGLTNDSVGIKAMDAGLNIKKLNEDDKVVALAGNPNVGKSTVFNELTGLNQHTGNWPGKTVTNAFGYCTYNQKNYVMVDIPGTYSLTAHSAEEEVARNYICFGEPDAVVVVCDATCLERNLNLVLQTIEITDKVVVCINLMDEAKRKNICIDIDALSQQLGVPVIETTARSGDGLDNIMKAIEQMKIQNPIKIKYIKPIEHAISIVEPTIYEKVGEKINARWLSLKLLDYDKSLILELNKYLGFSILEDKQVAAKINIAKTYLQESGIYAEQLRDKIVSCIVLTAEGISNDTVFFKSQFYNSKDRKLDRILTGKWTGFPIMIALLAIIFWITIVGSNYPSQLLSNFFFYAEDKLIDFSIWLGVPKFLYEMLILGVFRVLAWVVYSYRYSEKLLHIAVIGNV